MAYRRDYPRPLERLAPPVGEIEASGAAPRWSRETREEKKTAMAAVSARLGLLAIPINNAGTGIYKRRGDTNAVESGYPGDAAASQERMR